MQKIVLHYTHAVGGFGYETVRSKWRLALGDSFGGSVPNAQGMNLDSSPYYIWVEIDVPALDFDLSSFQVNPKLICRYNIDSLGLKRCPFRLNIEIQVTTTT